MKKLIAFLTLIAILYISSGQTYEQQSLIPLLERWLPSRPFEGLLGHLQIPYWGRVISVEERGYYYFLEFLLRKGAHLGIFALIGLTAVGILKKPLPAFLLAAVIAALDEFRQSLTGGRTPTFEDVLLDCAGAAIAISLWMLFSKNRAKRGGDVRTS